MQYFWAFTHVGNVTEFVGDSWSDAGFDVDEAGNPTHDANRNTVANWSVSDVDTREHHALIRDAYAGDGNRIGDKTAFVDWISANGIEDRTFLFQEYANEITVRCAYCDRDVPCGVGEASPPDETDDEAWDALAEDHEEWCEWINTRAHRVGC